MVIVQYYLKLKWIKVKWEKTCLKKGEPSSKAKYYILSDSEKVPWGNVEKKDNNPSEKIWISKFISSWMTVYKISQTTYLLHNGSAS